ncbi:MAG: InlB B-repeat-containing protein [Bacilli bacterium]
MKKKKKILMPIMALVLSVILFGYQVPNLKSAAPEVIPKVYSPGSIIIEKEESSSTSEIVAFSGTITLEDYTFITTNSANYFLNDILIELKDPKVTEFTETGTKIYSYIILFTETELNIDVSENSDSSHYITFYFAAELGIEYIKLQHAVLENPKVTFMDGEVQYLVKEIEKGNIVTPPASPTKEGYVFVGWYKDAELTETFNFSETVTEDMTLYAKFIEDSGGVVIPPEETKENNKTLYFVGAAALLLIAYITINLQRRKENKNEN